MKFTTVATDTFQKFQLNAGILLTEFDPSNPTVDRSKIFAATSGGTTFTATPTFQDLGEDVDNVPANTKELKVLDSVEATMTGTLKTTDTTVAKRLMAAADISSGGKITPRADLKGDDFSDIWWVGDYSNANSGTNAGFIAIRLINALSTGGFSLQPNDKGKGDFSFTFTGHYSINDMSVLPYEIYIVSGSDSTSDATLSALTIADLTLSPAFSSGVLEYAATTTDASNAVTATKNDSDATVAITVNGDSLTNGTAPTWATGENLVVVTVTNDDATKAYKVTVTKSA